ncbi:16S rRNA (cytidine(1402)-2'-O)-methyltransferase [Halobacillus faecis]
MNVQKSFMDHEQGTLYIVPTPIGNLEDMTFRAVNTLKEVDLIGAEDTRNSRKLLNHFEISTTLVSYHEHNKHTKGPELLERLRDGKNIAIVSDAGMPGISDPGTDLVQRAVDADVPVVVLPGANAALPALAGSGLSTEGFYFHGFLPRKKKDRAAVLQQLQSVQVTLVFYESPHRLKEMLTHVHDVLGNRKASLVRELTKRYEEYVRGDLGELVDWAHSEQVRGEFCVVIEGADEVESEDSQWWTRLSVVDHVQHYIDNDGMRNKEAIKQTALDRKLPKREVYQAYHVEE